MALSLTLAQLILKTRLDTPEKVEQFHLLRRQAFEAVEKVYADRAASYNFDHEPTEEMVYGPVSLASEIFKRARRLTGLLSPLRPVALRLSDLNRILDVTVDLISYLSWFYALIKIAGVNGHANCDDKPAYVEESYNEANHQ